MLTTMAQSPASYLIHIIMYMYLVQHSLPSLFPIPVLVHWSIVWQKWHISHPIELECYSGNLGLVPKIGVSKCAIYGRKWFANFDTNQETLIEVQWMTYPRLEIMDVFFIQLPKLLQKQNV